MARGTMFEIGEQGCDIDELGKLDESEFYDRLDTLSVSYVKNHDKYTTESEIENLTERFQSCGFPVREITNEKGIALKVIGPLGKEELDAAKAAYFKSQFQLLSNLMQAVDMEKFITDSFAYQLASAVEDTYGDCICLDAGMGVREIHTMDKFIRLMQPDKGYYLGPKAVLLH